MYDTIDKLTHVTGFLSMVAQNLVFKWNVLRTEIRAATLWAGLIYNTMATVGVICIT